MAGLSLGLGFGLTRQGGRGLRSDFRAVMPSRSTYTRTGAATGLTSAGLIQLFAANAPQRTDRGLALEPERTNLMTRFAPTYDQVTGSKSGGADTTEPASPPSAGLAWLTYDNSAVGAHGYMTTTLPGSTGHTMSCLVETADGTQPNLGGNSASGDFSFVVGGGIATAVSATYKRLSGNTWLVTGVASTTSSPRQTAGVVRYPTQNTRILKFSGLHVVLGNVATSPIITTGAAATRGLPVMTEPVPGGHTRALLTFADASTLLVESLTPGGTFDYVAPILAASKGRFGASELVTREWKA